jgi:hypothetical protein
MFIVPQNREVHLYRQAPGFLLVVRKDFQVCDESFLTLLQNVLRLIFPGIVEQELLWKSISWPLPSNGRILFRNYPSLQPSCHSTNYIHCNCMSYFYL